jgi:hypothetical protein
VIYLDTEEHRRFEISKIHYVHQSIFGDSFRLAEVNEPWKMTNEVMNNENIPLSNQHVAVIFPEVEWSNIHWGNNSITVNQFVIAGVINYRLYPVKIIANQDVISLD